LEINRVRYKEKEGAAEREDIKRKKEGKKFKFKYFYY